MTNHVNDMVGPCFIRLSECKVFMIISSPLVKEAKHITVWLCLHLLSVLTKGGRPELDGIAPPRLQNWNSVTPNSICQFFLHCLSSIQTNSTKRVSWTHLSCQQSFHYMFLEWSVYCLTGIVYLKPCTNEFSFERYDASIFWQRSGQSAWNYEGG